MLPSDVYTVREATAADDLALLELAALADEPAIARPALVAEVGGFVTSAMSVADGRVVSDPYQDTAVLAVILRAQLA